MVVTALCMAGCNYGRSQQTQQSILGTWDTRESADGKPFHFVANFRSDSTYDGTANGNTVVTGRYFMTGDTIVFNEDVCGGTFSGFYRLRYSGNSVKFELLQDSCQMRIRGVDRVSLDRVRGL